jgi:hypothetical protein
MEQQCQSRFRMRYQAPVQVPRIIGEKYSRLGLSGIDKLHERECAGQSDREPGSSRRRCG